MTAFDRKLAAFKSMNISPKKKEEKIIVFESRANYMVPENEIQIWVNNGWKFNETGGYMYRKNREKVYVDIKLPSDPDLIENLEYLTNKLIVLQNQLRELENLPFSLKNMEKTNPIKNKIEELRKNIKNISKKNSII